MLKPILLLLIFVLLIDPCKSQNTFASEFLTESFKQNVDVLGTNILACKNNSFTCAFHLLNTNTNENSSIIFNADRCTNILWGKTLKTSEGGEEQFVSDRNRGYYFSFLHNGDYAKSDSGFYAILKLDSVGNKNWSKKLHVPLFFEASSISINSTMDGGCIIAGVMDSTGSNNNFVFLAKLTSNGKTAWTKKYTIHNSLFAYNSRKIIQLKSKDYVFILDRSGVDNYIIKTDSTGKILWAKQLIDYTSLFDACVDDSSNIVLAGNTISPFSKINGIPILIKLDESGNKIWCYKYLDSLNSSFGSVIADQKGHLYLSFKASFMNSIPAGNTLINLNNDGKINWAKNYSFLKSGGLGNLAFSPDSAIISISDLSLNALNILKSDKNGFIGCDEKNLNVNQIPFNFVENYISTSSYPGLFISDSNIVLSPLKKLSKNIICSHPFLPNPNLGQDTVLCSGLSYTLYKGSYNTGTQTLWSTGDTGTSITVTKSGRYWLRLSHGYCTSTDTVSVVFRDQIKSGLVKKQAICPYDSVLLQVKDTAVAKYYWITPNKTIITANKIIAKDSGNYYLMLSGTTACSAVDTVHISYYVLPKAKAGPDTVLCRDQVYTMQCSGGISYQWIPSKYLSSATDPNAKAILPNTQQYILVVGNKQGCRDTSQVLLKVRPALRVKAIAKDSSICAGAIARLFMQAHGGDSLHYQVTWPDDQLKGDSIAIHPTRSAWHKVVLNDNCTPIPATDSVFIRVTPKTIAGFHFVPASPVKAQSQIQFLNSSQNASAYLWNLGSKKDSSHAVSPEFIYTDTGQHKIFLVAYGLNGCPNDTAYGLIKIIDGTIAIYIPNTFSPNGDGINDFFDINGTGIKSYSYTIYNRWGELVFSKEHGNVGLGVAGQARKDGASGWDGNCNGVPVPEGVYLYQMDIVDIDGYHHYLSGTVQVLR